MARAHFAARLAVETDPSDLHADAALIGRAFTLADVRSAQSWEQGRIPGAVHVPGREIAARHAAGTLAAVLPPRLPVVVYCWGPGCNGAVKAALALAERGYQVKELLGGFEYWVREGFAYLRGEAEHVDPPIDPLTAPGAGSSAVPVVQSPAASSAATVAASFAAVVAAVSQRPADIDCGC